MWLFPPIFNQYLAFKIRLFTCLPAFLPSKPAERRGWREKHQAGSLPGKRREGKQREVQEGWSEKRGGQVRNVIAAEVPGESDDAK